jgi:hypothetical protein
VMGGRDGLGTDVAATGNVGGEVGGDGERACLDVISKVYAAEFALVLRGHFSDFPMIFHLFGQFRPFLRAVFPFFAFFPTSAPVFPSNESRGRTIAHLK